MFDRQMTGVGEMGTSVCGTRLELIDSEFVRFMGKSGRWDQSAQEIWGKDYRVLQRQSEALSNRTSLFAWVEKVTKIVEGARDCHNHQSIVH